MPSHSKGTPSLAEAWKPSQIPGAQKSSHKEVMRRYRAKRSREAKRIEVWIERAEYLELLKKYSDLNQTQVINRLIEIVAGGVKEEDEDDQRHKEQNIEEMIRKLLETFEKLAWR